MRALSSLVLAFAALTLQPTRAASPVPITLEVQGRANAHVSLVSAGSFVIAAWAASTPDGTTDVFTAVSRDAGVTFGGPVRVNNRPGDARVNGEQPPRVALVPRAGGAPQVTVLWTAKGQSGTVLRSARSDDAGQTYTAAALVPGTDVPGNRGWQAIGADQTGSVHAVWLDHRRMADPDAAKTATAHRHGGQREGAPPPGGTRPDGVAMAQKSDLYFDTLTDAAAPRPLTPGVCYCCKTGMAFGAANQIYLAWRHVYPGNFRDMAFAMSLDGGRRFSDPLRVSEDNWMLEGCPDDGPALHVDPAGRIHIVWPAVVQESGAPVKALFHAMSADGRAFGPRVRIPTRGQANHPQLAVARDGTLHLAWDEAAAGTRQIVTGSGRVDQVGLVTFSRTPLTGAAGVYPMVAAVENGALVAWTAGPPATSVVRVARVRVARVRVARVRVAKVARVP